jgi:hypothetical protein
MKDNKKRWHDRKSQFFLWIEHLAFYGVIFIFFVVEPLIYFCIEFTVFMKDSNKKMRDWWASFQSTHQQWIERSVVYFKWLVMFTPVYFLLALIHIFFPTNAVSARYLLSALVQSEAAIVAIVITLTLIAVQLTASAYSPRVVNIFRKKPDMWILLILYGISIFFGLIVLRVVKEAEGGFVIQGAIWLFGHIPIFIWSNQNFSDCLISPLFEHLVSLALLLGIFTFVALVPYIYNITDLLKPENIIKQLASDINRNKFLDSHLLCWDNVSENDSWKLRRFLMVDLGLGWAKNAEIPQPDDKKKFRIVNGKNSVEININKEEKKARLTISGGGTYDLRVKDEKGKLNLYFNLNEDPIQPIVDIIRSSIRKYDSETTRVGLEALTNQVINEIDLDCAENISDSFCTRLQGVGKLAASVTDEESTLKVIENLKKFGENTVSKQLKDATNDAVTSLEAVGIAATRKGTGLEDAVGYAALSLGAVGKAAAEKKLNNAIVQTALSLGAVGKAAAEKKLNNAIVQTACYLWDVEDKTVEKVVEVEILKKVSEQVASSLKEVGIASAEKGKDLEKETIRVLLELKKVGIVAAEKKLVAAFVRTALSLEAVGNAAAGKKLNDAVAQTACYLRDVEDKAANEVADVEILKSLSEQVASSLREVGKAAVKNELISAIKDIADSLSAVGKIAVGKKFDNAIRIVASSLLAVGTAVKKWGLEEETRQLASFLYVLSTSSEKIVKEEIQDHESNSDGQDLCYFKEFIKSYEEMSQK